MGVRVASTAIGVPHLGQVLPRGATVYGTLHRVVGTVVTIGRTAGMTPVERSCPRIRHKGVGAFGSEALDLWLTIREIPELRPCRAAVVAARKGAILVPGVICIVVVGPPVRE